MTESLLEIALVTGISVIGFFCRSVLVELREIRKDLHNVALEHGERISMLEAKQTIKL